MITQEDAEKECATCGVTKPLSAFKKHPGFKVDGREKHCNDCRKIKWPRNKIREAEAARVRNALPETLARRRELRSLPSAKAKLLEQTRRYRSLNREKANAHAAVSRAVQSGKIIPQLCWVCGGVAEAHHASYAKDARLDVSWLCKRHHYEVHK